MVNLYNLLKVAPTAPEEEIKKAINKELRIWSNRTNAPQIQRRQEAERMVKLLEEAENTLLNASRRAEYDRQFKSAPKDERHIDEADVAGQGDIDLVQEAWRLLIAGNVADALYVATKATQVQGNNSEAWAILGQAKYQWGETEDAIYEYKRAIQLKPNEASYYFDLGNIYESAERWDDALQQYQRATQIDPRTTMYRAAIGGLYVRHSMYEKGVEILERCVQEEPDNQSYQWMLALAYHDGMLTSWWKNPEDGMYYCISKEQADTAKRIIYKAKSLKFNDEELSATIAKTEQLVDSMYERQFKGSWIMVIIWGLFYIVPGALWWFVNRRPQYKINKDIHDIVELGKKDALVGGELGAYYSALPPGFKWAATLPRFVVWILILLLSPITFIYAAYDNYNEPSGPPVMEPAKVEPPVMEPAKVEPPVMESAKVEPPVMESAKVEPPVMEPAKVEPPVMEPAKVEPPVMEPAKVEPPVMESASDKQYVPANTAKMPSVEKKAVEQQSAEKGGKQPDIETISVIKPTPVSSPKSNLKWIIIGIVSLVVVVAVSVSLYLVSQKKDERTVVQQQISKNVMPTYSKNDSARILALDALRNGTDLSVTVSKIPKLKKVVEAAKELADISPRYQEQVTTAENTLSSAMQNRDKNILAYFGKVVELSRYKTDQISYAMSVINNSDLTLREKKVIELLTKHIDYLSKNTENDPAKLLSDFNMQFNNFID